MGSQESKVERPQENKVERSQETVFSESVVVESAPSTPILTPLDPRSPSANIARTPLETILGANAVEKCGNKEVCNVILGMDPRSPTVEFNRTPIIIGSVAKPQNKNLENVLKQEIQKTPVSRSVPPKLLESSPISVASNYNKRKSFVGLLETNLDYTETDLDTVQANQSLPVEITEDLPCNKLKDQMEALYIKSAVTESLEKCDKNEKEEKIVNITAQVKDFDKKLTNLIYEDDNDDVKLTLKVAKVRENNRTPLSDKNLNEDKRAKNRLKVSDKPRKSDGSKIPVFKDYHCRKVALQCENTPPKKLEDLHKKVPHWDADKTLII